MDHYYPQATDEKDPRMQALPATVVQPWKAWWPQELHREESGYYAVDYHGSASAAIETSGNSRRFAKPWLEWPFKAPPTYSKPDHNQVFLRGRSRIRAEMDGVKII
jgi:hypothetical protein